MHIECFNQILSLLKFSSVMCNHNPALAITVFNGFSANSRKPLQIPALPCNVSLYASQKIGKAQHEIGTAEHLAHHWELQLKPMTYSYGRMAKRAKHSMKRDKDKKTFWQNLCLLWLYKVMTTRQNPGRWVPCCSLREAIPHNTSKETSPRTAHLVPRCEVMADHSQYSILSA